MVRFILLILILLTALPLLVACDGSDGNAVEAGYALTLIAEDDAPGLFSVRVADGRGEPVTDVTVSLEGNMTHAGMIPVFSESVWDGADGAEDGLYSVPFEFTMLGDWIITVQIEDRAGRRVMQNIDVSVTSTGVTVE